MHQHGKHCGLVKHLSCLEYAKLQDLAPPKTEQFGKEQLYHCGKQHEQANYPFRLALKQESGAFCCTRG